MIIKQIATHRLRRVQRRAVNLHRLPPLSDDQLNAIFGTPDSVEYRGNGWELPDDDLDALFGTAEMSRAYVS